MASGVYESIEEFEAALMAAIPDVLLNEVGDYVEDVLSLHIQSDIYGAYTPKPGGWINDTTYQRRHALEWGIQSTIEASGHEVVLGTTSVSAPSPAIIRGHSTWGSEDGAFLDLLASGNMGISGCQFPRDAIAGAQAEVDASIGMIDALFEQGLDRALG